MSSHLIQREKHFKLIADSVEGLRTFLYELDTEGTSVPKNLISALENFIVKIEPEEYHYIVLNNDSKIKLFKDCESYPDRIKKDKDNMSMWKEKDSKSIAQSNIYFQLQLFSGRIVNLFSPLGDQSLSTKISTFLMHSII